MSSQTLVVRWAVIGLWVIVPIIALSDAALNAAYWVFGINVLGDNVVVIAPRPPVVGRQLTGLLAVLPGFAAWLAALFNLHRLLSLFRRGETVSLTTVSRVRAFAGLAFLSAVLDMLTSGARRWAQGEFDGAIWTHIQLSGDGLWLIFIALVFMLISSALLEATVYKDEAESYL